MGDLRLLTLNVNCSKHRRSIFKLLEELKVFITEKEVDILSLTETDIENQELAQDFSIDGYGTFTQKSDGKIRTILLVKDNITVKNVTEETLIPSVSIEIEQKGQKPIFISSVYRQWSTANALAELNDLRKILTKSVNKKVVVMGDFNLDVKQLTSKSYCHHKLGKELVNICEEFGLEIKEGGPTYFHNHGSSTIDFFIVREGLPCMVGVESFGNSDHEAASLDIELFKSQEPLKARSLKCKEIKVRCPIKNEREFKAEMNIAMQEASYNMFMTGDVDEKAKTFISTFKRILDKHAPEKIKKIKALKPKHALSNETLIVRKERNRARNAWLSASPDEKKIRMEAYKRLRNRVNSMIKRDRVTKTEYDLSNGRSPYAIADSLLGKANKKDDRICLVENGKHIKDESETATILNEYFVEKIRMLKKRIDPDAQTDPLSNLSVKKSKFKFQLVSIELVEKIITKMKSSNSCGPDLLTSKMLKLVKSEISPAISVLVNASLESGVYPSMFKEAKVIPLFKNKGKREDKANYRPVSNLSTVGKVIEIAANLQITRYCERIGILGDHQHGFRQGRSTSSALISSLVKWQNAKEQRKYTGCLIYDLSAAYDTICPDILVKKADRYGFDMTACAWLLSFTTNRTQAVKIGMKYSELKVLECGIPQGSPLSCMLFLLYVGDLPDWVQKGRIQGFADDTIHHVSADSAEEAVDKLEKEAKKIFAYFASNELVANPSKTAFLMIRPSKSVTNEMSILVNGVKIKESISERILGIQVQRSLQWNEQVDKVLRKVNYGIATLRQLRGIIRKKGLKMIAEGIVMSHIRYGISVYLSGSIRIVQSDPLKPELEKLQIKQNDTLRVILNKERKEHVSRMALLEESNMQSVNQIAAGAVLMELWRAKKNNIKSIVDSFGKDKSERRENRIRTSANKNSFISKSALLWNESGKTFQNLTTTETGAKRIVKKFVEKLPMV